MNTRANIETAALSLISAGIIALVALTWNSSITIASQGTDLRNIRDILSGQAVGIIGLRQEVALMVDKDYYAADARKDLDKVYQTIDSIERRLISLEQEGR